MDPNYPLHFLGVPVPPLPQWSGQIPEIPDHILLALPPMSLRLRQELGVVPPAGRGVPRLGRGFLGRGVPPRPIGVPFVPPRPPVFDVPAGHGVPRLGRDPPTGFLGVPPTGRGVPPTGRGVPPRPIGVPPIGFPGDVVPRRPLVSDVPIGGVPDITLHQLADGDPVPVPHDFGWDPVPPVDDFGLLEDPVPLVDDFGWLEDPVLPVDDFGWLPEPVPAVDDMSDFGWLEDPVPPVPVDDVDCFMDPAEAPDLPMVDGFEEAPLVWAGFGVLLPIWEAAGFGKRRRLG